MVSYQYKSNRYRPAASFVMDSMKRYAIAPLVLILVVGSAFTAAQTLGSPAPVYSVSRVRAGLERDPRTWLGRTVFVRGRVTAAACAWPGASCPPPLHTFCRHGSPCLSTPSSPTSPTSLMVTMELGDDDASRPSAILPLEWGAEDNVLTLLRRLPVVGQLAPAAQAVRVGMDGVYRVRLTRVRGRRIASFRDEAVLLDPAPFPAPSGTAWASHG